MAKFFGLNGLQIFITTLHYHVVFVDTKPTSDTSGWEADGWGDFEAEQPSKKDTKNSDRDAERKKRQEERRLKQQQARQKRSAGLGGTKPSGLGDVKKD